MTLKLLIPTDEIHPDAIGDIGKSLSNEAATLVKGAHQVTVIIRSTNAAIRRILAPTRASKLYYLYPLLLLVNVVWTTAH